ncbi:hypothetical protein ACSMXN_04775 [Jatrophihabitans sp. DSM 45814]
MTTEQPAVASAHQSVGSEPAVPAAGSAMQGAYQAEASGDLVAMSFPGARRLAGWLFWVVFPLVCFLALISAVTTIVGHIGDQPNGVRGTYVASRTCSRGICLVAGTFTSDDGQLKVTSLLGDPRWASGTEHRVVYDRTSVEVIGLSQWDPTPSVLAGLGGVTYLGVVGYIVLAGRRRSTPAALMKQPDEDHSD